MQNIPLPRSIQYQPGDEPNTFTVIIEPCFSGYGTTLGNALRRVLLSSLPGAAVTAIKIDGAQHEFATLEYIKEDVVQIILNVKQLRCRVHTAEPVKLTLEKTGEGEIKAGDISKNSDVEIINTDLTLATLTDKNSKFKMELWVSQGRGYVPVEARDEETKEIGVLAVDAMYSPIFNVGYRVENTRVGQMTNFDKLIMQIETDGTIEIEDAVKESAKILVSHFKVVSGETPTDEEDEAVTEETEQTEVEKEAAE